MFPEITLMFLTLFCKIAIQYFTYNTVRYFLKATTLLHTIHKKLMLFMVSVLYTVHSSMYRNLAETHTLESLYSGLFSKYLCTVSVQCTVQYTSH